MSEHKSDKDMILELKAKIHELRAKKLFTIEHLEEQAQKFDKELEEINTDLRNCKIDSKVAIALIKGVDSRKGILRELRLASSFLTREEERLELEMLKVSGS